MIKPSDVVQKVSQYMFDHYSKDNGKLLVHLGALGWVLGSAAQIGVVLGDKSIDKEQKRFLLPQEAADAVVNIGMYYSICEFIKRGADKLVERGVLLTDDVAKAIAKLNPKNHGAFDFQNWQNFFTKEELKSNLTKLLGDIDSISAFKNLSTDEQAGVKNLAKAALAKLEDHKDNVGVISAIAASVLACNIVTPYVRNIAASKIQKHVTHEEAVQIRKTQIKENITTINPLPLSFKAFNGYNAFSKVKI